MASVGVVSSPKSHEYVMSSPSASVAVLSKVTVPPAPVGEPPRQGERGGGPGPAVLPGPDAGGPVLPHPSHRSGDRASYGVQRHEPASFLALPNPLRRGLLLSEKARILTRSASEGKSAKEANLLATLACASS